MEKIMNSDKNKLVYELSQINLTLSENQINQFMNYYDLLIEWNNVMNLTTITDFEEVVMKHFIDSLSIVKYVDLSQLETAIDIGTGAGFPGIPLKIAFPNIKFTLLDSVNKKVDFLNDVIDNLNLQDITAIHGRAEDLAQMSDQREMYDIAVSRAVAQLNTLAEYCMPFVKEGGMFVPYKSGEIEQELLNANNAVKIFGGNIVKVEHFILPNSDINRSFVIIKKNEKTPNKYPRKAGKPSKQPIL
jgi:16S rRNA (guanine527-N7)-methyltransferase